MENTFQIPKDILSLVSKLNNDEIAELFLLILENANGNPMESDNTNVNNVLLVVKSGIKADNKKKEIHSEMIDYIYSKYPSRCPVSNSFTGKTGKNKDKIKTLLNTTSADYIIFAIETYIEDCKNSNRYMKNFSTFLNNIPDYSENEVKTEKESDKVFTYELFGREYKGSKSRYDRDKEMYGDKVTLKTNV